MLFPIDWPANLQTFLRNSYGEPITIDRLNGLLPERGSFRLTFATQKVIVKKSQESREWHFYREGAPVLRQNGIEIPCLHGTYQEAGMYWIVMEEISHAFPQNRWQADSEQIAMLSRLHALTWGRTLAIPEPFVPAWDESLLERAMTFFPPAIAAEIKPILDAALLPTRRLLEPYCTLSGDPNPTNWGVRDDGTVVLFDWERVGNGSPAIDLAITIPGVGTSDDSLESLVATQYLRNWDSLTPVFPFSIKELVLQIKLAKIWTSLEFLANNASLLDAKTVSWLTDRLPAKIVEYRYVTGSRRIGTKRSCPTK